MKIIADLHTHTLVSEHAYSTLNEMVERSKLLGKKGMAVTEHGFAIADSPSEWYYCNLRALPDVIDDNFLLLKGVEANVLDVSGKIDMPEEILKKLDWVIASLHRVCIEPMGYEKATELWLNVAENPHIDMIGHSEQKEFLYDYDLVTKAFCKNNKVVEMNAASKFARPGNEENLRKLALACKKNGTKIAVNGDAHSVYNLGQEAHIIEMLSGIEFPEEQVINSSMPRLLNELKVHKREVFKRIDGMLTIE